MKTKKRQLKNSSKSNNHPKGEKNWGTFLAAFGVCAILTCVESSFGAGLLKPINGGDENDVYMKSHNVNVTINNGFAKTEIDQIFFNRGTNDLKAIYSFPVPKEASLSELSLWINGQEVIGEVLEKEKAKEIHDQQVAKGNDTALAEKNDHKTFEVSVYPVRANAETRVRLVYYQPISIDLNVGRYVYQLAEGGVDEEQMRFWSVDDKVHESFNFNLELKSAFPIDDVRIPGLSNKAIVEKQQNNANKTSIGDVYNIKIESPTGQSLNRDIVVYYKLSDNIPARVEIVPYKKDSASTGTFMVVVTPAADLKRISEGTDWTFVLDTSGSMSGGKISTLIDGVSRVVGKMSSNDRYRIITFSNSASDFTGGYITANPENVQKTLSQLNQMQANGGTNLYAGLKKAYSKLDDDRTTGVILVTDGVANIGQTGHANFLKLLKDYDIRLFTFVIGNSANQPLLDRLSKESGGFAMNISDSDDIIGRIMQAKAKVLHENLHDVELKFHGEKVKNITPAKAPNLYQGQQLVMFGQYDGNGDVSLELKAKISGVEKSWTCNATLPDIDTDNPELERLWALSRIEEIMQEIRDKGENNSLRKKIVNLGKEYSLVTNYTSMLVISKLKMEELGLQRSNADRVNTERKAQQARKSQPVKSYRVDNQPNNNSRKMFDGKSSPGFGSGPVGPAFIALAMWIKRKKQK